MTKSKLRWVFLALIFVSLSMGAAAAVSAYFPDPGSPPAIYDDFNWSSIGNKFWHVDANGATAVVMDGRLHLRGHRVELDRRMQTDPRETDVVVKVLGKKFHKLGVGLGQFHGGVLSLEFDNDGVKCGRGTDQGWRVDVMKAWNPPPLGRWFYLELRVVNPYPGATTLRGTQKKPIALTCSLYDANRRLLVGVSPTEPKPNSHYAGLDQVVLQTWDSGNDYLVDWLYAGPPSGNPLHR